MAAVRDWLIPYDDLLSDLVARIEELERRIDGIIQPGVIDQVNETGDRVRVRFANNLSPWIKPLMPQAGEIRQKFTPGKGEQVLLLNWAGGDNSSQAFALCGVYSDSIQPPTGSKDEHVIDWGNGLKLTINRKAKTVKWSAPGGVEFDTKELHSTGELSDQVRKVSEDRTIYNGHDHIGNLGRPVSPPQQIQ